MRALMLTAVFLVGCRSTWPEGATVTSPSGQRLCAKHRIPLVTIRAYQAPTHGDRVDLVHEGGRPYYHIVGEHCPNHIPEHVALHPAWILREPTTIAYCPLCQKELLDGLRVPDEKAALSFAQYVLPIWGGRGVPTTAPYQVSLRGDVWTVMCSMKDGRRATIKISKETGNVISTDFRNSSNQSMQPTAGRSDASRYFMKTRPFQAALASASGG
jgi:hypothetical protein